MINDYQNWTGSRPELISLIKLLEKENPKLYKFFSKQLGSIVRLMKEEFNNLLMKELCQNQFLKIRNISIFEHLVRYLSAIILRNKGYPVKIIKQSLDISGFDFLKNEFDMETDDKLLEKQKLEILIYQKD